MDNEELKKKIIDVLRDNREYELRYYPDDNNTEVIIDYEAIADALIAAGLVADVQSLVDGNCVLYVKGKGFMRLYNEQDINKMIHCAEVNEKMFNNLYEEISENMRVLSKEWYKYQAEKELAEEKNND